MGACLHYFYSTMTKRDQQWLQEIMALMNDVMVLNLWQENKQTISLHLSQAT